MSWFSDILGWLPWIAGGGAVTGVLAAVLMWKGSGIAERVLDIFGPTVGLILQKIAAGFFWSVEQLGKGMGVVCSDWRAFSFAVVTALVASAAFGDKVSPVARAEKKELAACKVQVKTVVKKQQCPKSTFQWPF